MNRLLEKPNLDDAFDGGQERGLRDINVAVSKRVQHTLFEWLRVPMRQENVVLEPIDEDQTLTGRQGFPRFTSNNLKRQRDILASPHISQAMFLESPSPRHVSSPETILRDRKPAGCLSGAFESDNLSRTVRHVLPLPDRRSLILEKNRC